MKILNTIPEVKEQITEWKKQGFRIGFVPTMGYLHEGHTSLVQKAKENDKIIVSIFINPMQFGPKEDLSSYPRDFEKDVALCQEMGVDLIFHPQEQEMYEEGFCSYVDMNGLTEELCGSSRPGHFRGVCTVVNKLFHIISPDRAYFGEKDAQQLAVIKRMVTDLNMDVEVVGCPIIREKDGLAKSSRNVYLTEEERKAALIISKSIFLGMEMVKNGEKNANIVLDAMVREIESEPLARIDYVKIVDLMKMQQVETIDSPILAAVAVYIGTTRLIDNFICD